MSRPEARQRKPLSTKATVDAQAAGYAAGRRSVSVSACPHRGSREQESLELRRAWLRGYAAARTDMTRLQAGQTLPDGQPW